MSKLIPSSCVLAALLLSAGTWAAQQQAPQAQVQQAQQPQQIQGPQPQQQAQLTPAQQEAAAKKAAADAKAAKEKEQLTAAMDRLSDRWRSQASAKGWRIQPPPASASLAPAAVGSLPPGAVRNAAEAGMVPPGVTPPEAGIPAPAPATGAAPRSMQALRAANVPIKSEKLGTAPPSEDVKTRQTPSLPKGTNPAVQKEHSPETANKQ